MKPYYLILALYILTTLPITAAGASSCVDANKVYKICSDQQPLFGQALEKAKTNKKNLLVVFGADWCPWCISLNKIFHDPKNLKQLGSKYELLEVGVYAYDSKEKIPSGIAVLDEVKKLSGDKKDHKGVPLMAVINPANGKAIFVDTEPLEKNTKTSKGHDVKKVFSVLEKAGAGVL